MGIEKNSIVNVYYTLSDEKGEVIDTNKGEEPLVYIQGQGMMIPGFEKALVGAHALETLSFVVTPDEGYGARRSENIIQVPRDVFVDSNPIEVGYQVTGEAPDGSPHVFQVLEVSDSHVTLDGNHPLAGEELHFEVTVLSVRAATKDELTRIDQVKHEHQTTYNPEESSEETMEES